MSPYDVVEAFERRVAYYAGAPYAVAVNSCTNAIALLARLALDIGAEGTAYIPKRTYVGVPYALKLAGARVVFEDTEWSGAYEIRMPLPLGNDGIRIIDSARRFTSDMYECGTLMCLSFHETKVLPIGDGGMILTDDLVAYSRLRKMRFDGRTPGLSVFDDTFTEPWALHCHMKPDVATRGLMLMAGVKQYNQDLPEEYPDLSAKLEGICS